MSEHGVVVAWERNGQAFTDRRYSRGHRWIFDGGVEVPASSSPLAVRPPMSVEAAVDPEEAFIASVSSCHMLWFLAIAAKQGFVVEGYRDEAMGVLGKDAEGKLAITEVLLRPRVAFAGQVQPTAEQHEALHHEAHEQCFIANSVKSRIRCEPV